MGSPSLPLLSVLFVAAAAATCAAGITLTKTTDSLDTRFRIGDALGGLVLLGITGSLPEIAVVYGAARHGHIPVIIGNLVGGIAIQTLLLALFDFAAGRRRPLSYLAGSVTLSLETVFAIAITAIALLATLVPARRALLRTNPLSAVIVVAWVVGLILINKARRVPRFNAVTEEPLRGRRHHERRAKENHAFYRGKSTGYVCAVFSFASLITLGAGYLLEESGTAVATRLGIGTGLFAATAMALATSLPEISTGLESIFIGDNQLAVSDIIGGNAFMLAIFLFADIVAGKPVLSYADHPDVWLGLVGIAMMAVYAISFLLRPRRCYFRLGVDSLALVVLYAVGIAAMARIR
jgi:cation:H+ antiporter